MRRIDLRLGNRKFSGRGVTVALLLPTVLILVVITFFMGSSIFLTPVPGGGQSSLQPPPVSDRDDEMDPDGTSGSGWQTVKPGSGAGAEGDGQVNDQFRENPGAGGIDGQTTTDDAAVDQSGQHGGPPASTAAGNQSVSDPDAAHSGTSSGDPLPGQVEPVTPQAPVSADNPGDEPDIRPGGNPGEAGQQTTDTDPTRVPTIKPTPKPAPRAKPGYVVYLTFDDGPSERTVEIRAILARYGIKATFFVNNKTSDRSKQILRQTVSQGHAVGMHTATHNYRVIYASTAAFMSDLDANYRYIYKTTGLKPRLVRFPGGSINDFNRSTHAAITRAVQARGYVYFDWNCSSGDSSSTVPSARKIVRNVINSAGSRKKLVILMHDAAGKRTTVEALPMVIEALQAKGYSFAKLTPNVTPVHFGG